MSTITIKNANGMIMGRVFFGDEANARTVMEGGEVKNWPAMMPWLRLGASMTLETEYPLSGGDWHPYTCFSGEHGSLIDIIVAGINDVCRGLEIDNPSYEEVEDALLILMDFYPDIRDHAKSLSASEFDDLIDEIISIRC